MFYVLNINFLYPQSFFVFDIIDLPFLYIDKL